MQSACPSTTTPTTRTVKKHPPILLLSDQGYEVKIFKLTEFSKYQNNPTFENKAENMRIYFNQDNQRIISQGGEVKYVLNQNQTWDSYSANRTVQINIQEIECNETVKDIQLMGFLQVKSASTFQQCISTALRYFKIESLPKNKKNIQFNFEREVQVFVR